MSQTNLVHAPPPPQPLIEDPVSGVLAKLQKATISFAISVCLSVCPLGTIRLTLDIPSRHFIYKYFWVNFRENFNVIKI